MHTFNISMAPHMNLTEHNIEDVIETILQEVCADQCEMRYGFYGDVNKFWSVKNGVTVLPINTYTLPLSRCTYLLLHNLISALVQDEKFHKKPTDDIVIYFDGCYLKDDYIEIRLGIGRNCVREQED